MQNRNCVPCLLGLEGPISEELKKLGVDENTMTEWIKGGTEHD